MPIEGDARERVNWSARGSWWHEERWDLDRRDTWLHCGRRRRSRPGSQCINPARQCQFWPFRVTFSAYFVPKDRDFLNPVVTADHRALHLEARYNYEAIGAASLWLGWNLSFGKALLVDVTPMVGGVLGSLDGVAAGYEVTVSYRTLQFYSAGEPTISAAGGHREIFLYNWSQLAYSPWAWLQVGVAVQRTKVYQTALDLQRGFLIGLTRKNVSPQQ